MMQRSIVVLAMVASAAATADPDTVRLNTFPNAKALPFHAGIERGIFAKHGVALELSFTENSTAQREGLAAGRFDVVHAAVDNAVAMVESGKGDVVIVTGGDNGMNEFFVQPHIASFADLRGRKLAVDAPNTAYAIQAKKILQKHGLKDGTDYTVVPVGRGELRLKAMAENRDYAAAILNLPFTIQAEQLGMKSLGNTVDILGPYQANGAFALRSWVESHGALLERTIAAYVESLRWVRRPENRAECVAILVAKLKIPRDVAERTYHALADPVRGFTPDARFDMEGFRNLLSLRAEIEGKGKGARSPESYLDLSYYRRALLALGD
ncbi:MAG TPA: ABC transporter substrate-binding protein [Burkholderiales bacterium]|nr:ABC transporter substrate-binding protein [Burkholderiales bacterium]